MERDFPPVLADDTLRNELRSLIQLGMTEDFHELGDVTSDATVPVTATGRCAVVAREPGIAAGLVTIPWIIETLNFDLNSQTHHTDGEPFSAGQTLAMVSGNARQILSAERMILNVVSRLSGIATLTSQYVERLAGTSARLYDTRKTTVGWRRLEKYAVRQGGGHNHRGGLYDAVLIKDNHLALAGDSAETALQPSAAIRRARTHLRQLGGAATDMIVEIEVDSLAQYHDAVAAAPDIILLDNFGLESLRDAVAHRNTHYPLVQLEASGGVNLSSIRAIGATGVDRISCGAITHHAVWLDVGLDWSA